MSLSLQSFTLLSTARHEDVVAGEWDVNDVRAQFAGVLGESEITDEPHGRDLTCNATLAGYSTADALRDDLTTLASKINKLTGTLTIVGNLAGTFENTTFKGFVMSAPGIKYDPVSGKYYCHGVYKFRQHKR